MNDVTHVRVISRVPLSHLEQFKNQWLGAVMGKVRLTTIDKEHTEVFPSGTLRVVSIRHDDESESDEVLVSVVLEVDRRGHLPSGKVVRLADPNTTRSLCVTDTWGPQVDGLEEGL